MRFEVTDIERRAMDAASVAMRGVPDALVLMNELCQWDDPPPPDERWEKKLAAACEIAVAFCKLANNKKAECQSLKGRLEKIAEQIDAPI